VSILAVPLKLGGFDTKSQKMTIEMSVQMLWTDSRLAFDDTCFEPRASWYVNHQKLPEALGTFTPRFYQSPSTAGLWMPPVNIDNLFPSGETPGYVINQHAFTVAKGGFVWYTYRLFLDVKCSLRFENMPFDEHQCGVTFLSQEPDTRLLLFNDAPKGSPTSNKEIFSDEATLDAMSNAEWTCTNISSSMGYGMRDLDYKNQQVTVDFTLKRKPYWYRNEVLGPTILLVAISWAGFFIARAAVPARVAAGLICYLTINNFTNTIAATLPKLSYPVDILTFMQLSKTFVFIAIIQYALANWLMRIEKRVEAANAAVAKELKHEVKETTAADIEQPSPDSRVHREGKEGKAEPAWQHDLALVGVEMGKEGGVLSSMGIKPGMRTARPKKLYTRKHLSKNGIDHFLVTADGRLRLRDQHLDVLFRYLYPVCYFVVCVVYWHKLLDE
jgi:hypothetical protein